MSTRMTDAERKEEARLLCEAARDQCDLLTFVQNALNQKGRKLPHSVAFNVCPSCGESHSDSTKLNVRGDVWTCFNCGEGGSIVKFAQIHWGMAYAVLAARALLGNQQYSAVAPAQHVPQQDDPAEKERLEALEQVFALIFERGHSSEAAGVAYLEGRGIPAHLQLEAYRRGVLRFLPSNAHNATQWLRENVGEGLLQRAGLWKQGKKMPGIAFRPMVFLLPSRKGAEFRLIRPAKEGELKSISYGIKDVPYHWVGPNGGRAVVVEGVIDMLSLIQLGCQCSVIALPGVASWRRRFDEWFGRLRREKEMSFILSLDPDTAGQKNTVDLLEEMRNARIPVTQRTPPGGGDINAYLQRVVEANKKAAA